MNDSKKPRILPLLYSKLSLSLTDLTSSPYLKPVFNIRKKQNPIKLPPQRTITTISHQITISKENISGTKNSLLKSNTSVARLPMINQSLSPISRDNKDISWDLVLDNTKFDKILRDFKEKLKSISEKPKIFALKIYFETFEEVLLLLPGLQILREIKDGLRNILKEESSVSDNIEFEKKAKLLEIKVEEYKKYKAEIDKKLKILSNENIELINQIEKLKKENDVFLGNTEGMKSQNYLNMLLEESKRKGETIKILNAENYELRKKDAKLMKMIEFARNKGTTYNFSKKSSIKEKENESIKINPKRSLPSKQLTVIPSKKKLKSLGDYNENENINSKKSSPVPELDITRIKSDSFLDLYENKEISDDVWLRE
ncbi:unnamed protein product [Blepharisma stoltei]|uniref:Uncharacterized protein n=1 Tax=Blepharisma stoltei TaxID=1481888 RepID=A0AAU9IHF5_9CILI|nr:unnamed protein product [Blepharisma stoltei]